MTSENKRLIEEYPFLRRRDWQGKVIENDDWTELDEMPNGWRKAFGEKLCQELKDLLIKANYLNEYKVTQIKEKYGELCWYSGGIPGEIAEEYSHLMRKYENLSAKTCINCGKPATMLSEGWISPYCNNCAKELEKHGITFRLIEVQNEEGKSQ